MTAVEKFELRKRGLKVTLPRIRVLETLENAEEPHMSAEDIYKSLLAAGEDVGLATVYRVLSQFESAGLVVRHHFDGAHCVFEIAKGEHHDHMVCLQSGKIINFHDEEIELLQKQIADKHGYVLVDHSLTLHVKPNN